MYAHSELISSSVNYEQLSENSQKMYAGIVSVVTIALFMLSVLLVLLVLYVIINSIISRRRQEFGIYKAIGGIWYLPVINHTIFSQIGAIKNHFEVSIWMLLAAVIVFIVTVFLISVRLAALIKKITVYSLLKD